VTTGIADADRRLAGLARESAPARLLQTMPMIGPVTALGFVAALDDVARFEGPHQVAAYLGLVPSERSSGEQQHRGRITKRGDSRTRWLLVEAAWRIRRSKDPALAPRNAWAERIATRRGKRVAIVALARRLAGILLTMCRTGTPYAAARLRSALPSPAAAYRAPIRVRRTVRGDEVTDTDAESATQLMAAGRGRRSVWRLPSPNHTLRRRVTRRWPSAYRSLSGISSTDD
jgi:hypothetical protein